MSKILVVDDEPDIRELLAITIGRMGHDAILASNLQEAKAQLATEAPALCLTDMKLPDGTGLDFIHHSQSLNPHLPVAMITAFGSIELALDALKAGAFDFLTKPLEVPALRNLISKALELNDTDAQNSEAVGFAGQSEQAQALRQQISKLSRSQAPVHIQGESGSGKEVVARAIHNSGPRAHAPFVPVNCGAIPSELVESELFGHIKGSFTGASADKIGLFEAANGGTLFLDEIADLPLLMQVKLLRAIQERAVKPVGSSEERAVDVRVLSATHKDLAQEVEDGRFRADLFYRVNVIDLKVPPLRERKADIEFFADLSLARLADQWAMAKPKLSSKARDALLEYDFPGNVRELENIMERAATLCDQNTIEPTDLKLPKNSAPRAVEASDMSAAYGDMEAYIANIERNIIRSAMEECKWNKADAAKLVGLSARQFRYKFDKLGLDENA